MKRRGVMMAGAVAIDFALTRSARAQNADAGHNLVERFAATLTARGMAGFASVIAGMMAQPR